MNILPLGYTIYYSWIIFQFIDPFGILITFYYLSDLVHWGIKYTQTNTHKQSVLLVKIIVWWTFPDKTFEYLFERHFFFMNLKLFNNFQPHFGAIVSLHILCNAFFFFINNQKWYKNEYSSIKKKEKLVYFARNLNKTQWYCDICRKYQQPNFDMKIFLFLKKKNERSKWRRRWKIHQNSVRE